MEEFRILINASSLGLGGASSVLRGIVESIPLARNERCFVLVGNSALITLAGTWTPAPGAAFIPIGRMGPWPISTLSSMVTAAKSARRLDPDVVVSINNPLLANNSPEVLYHHNLFYFSSYTAQLPLIHRLRISQARRLLRIAIPRAACNVFVSQHMLEAAVDFLGYLPPRALVLPNGCTIPRGLNPRSPKHTSSRILVVTSDEPHKRSALAVEVFAQLRSACPDRNWHLEIVSKDPHPRERTMVSELGLEGTVSFIDFLSPEDLRARYIGAFALLVTSDLESFALPALEAMQFGLPVVASDASAIPEIVRDGGLLVDPNDIDCYVGGLINLARHPDLWASYSRSGLARARGFSWQRTSAALLDRMRGLVRDYVH